jgi:hypothetical protein
MVNFQGAGTIAQDLGRLLGTIEGHTIHWIRLWCARLDSLEDRIIPPPFIPEEHDSSNLKLPGRQQHAYPARGLREVLRFAQCRTSRSFAVAGSRLPQCTVIPPWLFMRDIEKS